MLGSARTGLGPLGGIGGAPFGRGRALCMGDIAQESSPGREGRSSQASLPGPSMADQVAPSSSPEAAHWGKGWAVGKVQQPVVLTGTS